ncbi:hypothetical protein MUK42_26294 [Musa troglodytarum]|uniref:Uncharacterized protein n=1 Tax=Musa troglodytarum TaxID=320322 RepID=A0A9E7H505_9LILI|nr:hypothetical protein MUK42_26294 [Musa troglodytarum]
MEKKRQEAEARLQCNKGKACRFKRSFFSKEEDAISSAILLLACVVCSPRFHPAGKRMASKDFVPAGGGGNVSVREADDKEKAKVYCKSKGKVVGRRARSGGVLLMMPRLVDLSPFSFSALTNTFFVSISAPFNLQIVALREVNTNAVLRDVAIAMAQLEANPKAIQHIRYGNE